MLSSDGLINEAVFIESPRWPDVCFPMAMCKDRTIINIGCSVHDASLFSNVWTDVKKFHSGFQDGRSVQLDLAARSIIFKCMKLFLCGDSVKAACG